MNFLKLRQLFESRVNAGAHGRRQFVTDIGHMLGVRDRNGQRIYDRNGNQKLADDRQLKPEDFSLAQMAEAIIGPSWRQLYDPSNRVSMGDFINNLKLVGSEFPGDATAMLEATGVGIDPSAFANINTFTAAASGLIEVKVLEAFQNPQFITDELFPVEQTKMMGGQKVIGATRLGNVGVTRLPGKPHTRGQFAERWVQTPELRENGLAVDLLKETVFADLTGQVFDEAEAVGEWLGFRKEMENLSVFIGATQGSPYGFNYKGTFYNTYLANTAVVNSTFTNDQSNDLLGPDNVNSAMMLLLRMNDPETNTRVLVNPDTVVVNPEKYNRALYIFNADRYESRDAGAATQATAAELKAFGSGFNPYKGKFKVLTSPLLEQLCTAATTFDPPGLALSQANANKYWWMLDKKRAFRYMQNWPLVVVQAPAQQYEMLDKGIAATYFADERGRGSVRSIWHVCRNKN